MSQTQINLISAPKHPLYMELYNGDCLDIAPSLQNHMFDLVLTSTPYPGLRGFEMDWYEYWRWARVRFDAIRSAMNPLGSTLVLVINASRAHVPDLFNFYREVWGPLKFTHENLYVWDKLNAPPAGNLKRYDHDMWEFCFVVSIGQNPRYQPYREPYAASGLKGDSAKDRKPSVYGNMAGGHTELHPEGARQGNVIRLSPSGGQEVNRPRAKGGSFPLELARRFIHQFSWVGDWVLDPFCGVGTTLYAAREMGRNSVGIEIDQQTYKDAARWLQTS